MPFKSEAQRRLFEGVAHGMKPRTAHAPSPAVAQKFIADSQGKPLRQKIAQAMGK